MSRHVSLADDKRGRVPFAVVGVLLLASSLVLATTLRPNPAPEDTAVERAMAEVTAASQTAVRDGVATAGQRAAANPVVEPANTTVGRALNDSSPFRSALRLRAYLQVRSRLDRLSATSDGVEATASLPAATTTSGYEDAIERVSLQRAGGNNTSVRATVENVTLTASRDGDMVGRRNVTLSVVVPTPVLYVHERMQRYETRLNNSLAQPGLSQRLTARLYPITWARGYAQFGGAPIDNVLANRHVSLATNGAVLGVQRSVFGRSDPDGRQALGEATAMVGIEDIAAGTTNSVLADEVLARTNYEPASQNISTGASGLDAPQPNETMEVGINGTADAAFGEVAGPWALNETARAAYTVDVRVVTDRDHRSGGRPARPESPGANWSFLSERTTVASVTVVEDIDGGSTVPAGWHTLDRFGRLVDIEYRRSVTWHDGHGGYETTSRTGTERVAVRAALLGNHTNASVAPVRGISTAHDSAGSPLGGPNLADVEAAAEATLLDNASHDAVAESIAREEFEVETATVTADRPAGLYTWLYEDLRDLRETVRDINTTVERGAVGSFETNPHERLHDRLEARRDELVAAPETYDSTAQRARVAARVAYVDAVSERLTNRTEQRDSVASRLSSQLGNRTGGSLTALRRGLTAREARIPRARPAPSGPAGPVRTRVNAQPQYLTLASVDDDQSPAVNGSMHPLVARNVNVFAIPYGNAASAVLDTATGGVNRVGLGAAAETLRAANETNLTTPNATLAANRSRLRTGVQTATDHVGGVFAERVAAETAANSTASEAIVDDALARWNTTADRGMAVANNSAADAVAGVAADRQNLSVLEADWLRLRLRRATTTALSSPSARPQQGPVNQTAAVVRSVARDRIRAAIENRTVAEVEDLAERRLGRRTLPSGLPLLPPWGHYATTNVWWVTVEGEYARFSVSARHGTTASGGTALTYAREDAAVTLDVDDDGDAERLGRNRRIDFHVETGVVVVVPPRPRGVGDKDGNSVESSSGWPTAG